ncbi:MAG: DUF45 domain-containing protein [Planctomycetes bacterium]|nr:DUF45 domain-containing protein [Planctomycetota bacterium]MBI3833954.1 DUF45 domain-containing protein [Planctomycetota bacterium]
MSAMKESLRRWNPNRLPIIVFGFIAVIAANTYAAQRTVNLNKDCVVKFATTPEAKEILVKKDDFANRLCPFERATLLKSTSPVSTEDFLALTAAQAKEWTDDEVERFTSLIQTAASKTAWITTSFPKDVLLIKTTGKEQWDSPYTRSNAIIFPMSVLRLPKEILSDILVHELFHVLSRQHPELRTNLYSIEGFLACNEIEIPKSAELPRITNPDAPVVNAFMEVKQNGQDKLVAPVLLSSIADAEKASHAPLIKLIDLRLLELEKSGDRVVPKLDGGQIKLLKVDEVTDYLEKTGGNTEYIIHPEEILASNFIFVANGSTNVASENVIKELRKLLSK